MISSVITGLCPIMRPRWVAGKEQLVVGHRL